MRNSSVMHDLINSPKVRGCVHYCESQCHGGIFDCGHMPSRLNLSNLSCTAVPLTMISLHLVFIIIGTKPCVVGQLYRPLVDRSAVECCNHHAKVVVELQQLSSQINSLLCIRGGHNQIFPIQVMLRRV